MRLKGGIPILPKSKSASQFCRPNGHKKTHTIPIYTYRHQYIPTENLQKKPKKNMENPL